MKKFYLTFAAVSAVLAACTNDLPIVEGENHGTEEAVSEAIVFGSFAPAMTRADLYGAGAAGKLGNKFVVYGTKHTTAAEDNTAANDAVQFNNFQVQYTPSTAGTTESNSSDWEYVGLQAYDASPTSQGIKYWDYSATNGYTFYAFSSSDISYPQNATSDKVVVNKVTTDGTTLYNKGYAVTVKTNATLNNLYFSDRLPVAKADYKKTVDFTFRNIGSKVRVGFYETIPGYKVTIDNFYIDEDATVAVTDFAEMNNAKTDGFYASLQNVKRTVDQTLNVTYYDNTDATIENRPKMTQPNAGYDYALKLGNGTGIINKELSDNAASPTWVAGKAADNYYIPVFPFEDNLNPLLLKLDFTMTATDGSNDVIHVRGARAVIPTAYVKWKSNFAYTYIFKISDKTNGTTGKVDGNGDPIDDPEGLKPITFDAIIVDVTDELQETITSVSSNSITTYAEGATVDEYNSGKPIYVVVSDNSTHNVLTPDAIGTAAGEAQVYSLSKAVTEAEVLAQLNGSSMSFTKTPVAATIESTVPFTDGTNPAIGNVKFTPAAAGYYAYVYTTTAYVAPTYKAATGAYNSSTTYYMKTADNVYYAVVVTSAAAFAEHQANLYVVDPTAAGTPGVYDVKVIKVQ